MLAHVRLGTISITGRCLVGKKRADPVVCRSLVDGFYF